MNKQKVVEVLSGLIATCNDGENGFETAATALKDYHVKRLFNEYSFQRRSFRNELERLAKGLGSTPGKSGTMAGLFHRGWMNIKWAVTLGDDGAVIAEAERGEDLAVKAYRKALETDLPGEIRQVVEQQYEKVEQAHDRVRELERIAYEGDKQRIDPSLQRRRHIAAASHARLDTHRATAA
jgi:uncharacterized protein (TIGR02284 family)